MLAFTVKDEIIVKKSSLINPVQQISEESTLLDAVDQLKSKNMNLAIVIDPKTKKATGMITLKKIF
jgi:CBS domain containing-hemolysin-like protein